MIQKTYHITDYEPFKLRKILSDTASLPEYQSAEQVLVIVLEQCWDVGIIKEKTDIIKTMLPKAEIVGTNHFDAYEPEEAVHINTILTFMMFEKHAFAIDHIGLTENTDREVGKRLGDTISRYDPLKGVMLFISHTMRDVEAIISEADRQLTDVPFFGAASGALPVTPDEALSFVFDSDGIYTDTLAAVSFYGSDLHIRVSYNYGWTPVGKTMTVTDTDGDFIVTGIDGRPAADIYERYLGLDRKKGMINTVNICEFPLIIEKDGLMFGRVPFGSIKDGALSFGAAVKKGSRIRFSYGAQHIILSETYNDSKEFGIFSPQGMFMIVCGNRLIFLKDDEKKEIDYYRRICPDLAFTHGNSEIYRMNGKGGELHSALISVGIREGEKDRSILQCTVPPYPKKKDQSLFVPLEHRVMTFMHAVTNDLTEMTEKANAANEAKSTFLSNMSHEIRTPINAVLGMNEMILRECDDEQIIAYSENIRTAGNTLLGLINDILDFSKIEAGRLDIIPVDYGLASLLNDLVNMIQSRADAKELQFIVNVEPKTPNFLHGDEIRLKQIVTNILTNAVKYTEKGSVTLNVGFTENDGDTVGLRFSVADTGIGIKQEDMSKLFTAFERIEEERNRSIEGTGLGMNITQRLLAMMGSKLEVESEYGKGSVFGFTVKQQIVRNEPVGDFAAALDRSRAARQKYREKFTAPTANVLVVDDTKMNLTVFRSLLKQTKVQIDTAESGQECLDMSAKKKYDIIFLDHRMPDKDGIETLAELRAMRDNPNIGTPTVCLTANAVSGAKGTYLAAGFNNYLTKPIEPEKLEAMLLEYLPEEKVEAAGAGDTDAAAQTALPDLLTKISEIDTAAGVKHCGNEEIYLETLRTYAGSVQSSADEIERYWDADDISNVTVKVHALKSTSRVIGAADLGALAERLEAAGNSGDTGTLQKELGTLLERYRRLGEELAPLTARDDDALPLITDSELNDAYTLIRECLSVADYDSAMQVIEGMSEYSFPENEKDRFAKLKKAAAEVDYDAISDILAEGE